MLTEVDLAKLPDDEFRHELHAGLLVAEPRPFPLHAQIQARFIELLAGFARTHALGPVLGDAGFLLTHEPDTVRGPDVSFVRRNRWDAVADTGRFFPGAPDLAVEVLSPDDTASAVLDKVEDWLTAGTQSVWIVDPARHTVSIHRPSTAAKTFHVGEIVTDEPTLPGFRLPIAEIFE